jgi:hypothetical protein
MLLPIVVDVSFDPSLIRSDSRSEAEVISRVNAGRFVIHRPSPSSDSYSYNLLDGESLDLSMIDGQISQSSHCRIDLRDSLAHWKLNH